MNFQTFKCPDCGSMKNRDLNCAGCKEQGKPCPLVICCDCGAEVHRYEEDAPKGGAIPERGRWHVATPEAGDTWARTGELAKWTDARLKSEHLELYEAVYVTDCYGTRDLILLGAVTEELKRRGYRIAQLTDSRERKSTIFTKRPPRVKNAKRAERGAQVADAYRDIHPDEDELLDESLVGDLMADLMHYLRREGCDPLRAHNMALTHFNEED